MEPKILDSIKETLLAQKKQIMEELGHFSRHDEHEADDRTTKFPEYGDKPDENAQEISDYSTNVATERLLEKSLEDVDKSLERIKNGTYGICKYCHNPIGDKRLQARPTASSCMKCKTELQENE